MVVVVRLVHEIGPGRAGVETVLGVAALVRDAAGGVPVEAGAGGRGLGCGRMVVRAGRRAARDRHEITPLVRMLQAVYLQPGAVHRVHLAQLVRGHVARCEH